MVEAEALALQEKAGFVYLGGRMASGYSAAAHWC